MPDDSAPPPRLPSVPDALRRHRAAAAGVAVLLLLGAALYTLLAPAPVTATAQLGLTDPRGNSVFRTTGTSPTDLARFTQQRATFARSNQVLERAAGSLQDQTGLRELRSSVSTSVGTDADVLSITASAEAGEEAARRANAVAEAYREISAEQTQADADAALAALAEGPAEGAAALAGDAGADLSRELGLQASQLRLAAELYGDGVAWTEAADPAITGGGPALLRNLAIAGLLGVLGGVALAVALAARRPTAEDADAPFPILGAPLLGELEKGSRGEGFDVVAAALHRAAPSGVVAVSSAADDTDVTWLCAEIARAAASAGLRVAALDGATETQSLARLLSPGSDAGRSPAGRGPVDLFRLRTDEASVSRAELMSRLEEIKRDRDLVVVNCPPLSTPPAANILQSADAVVAVVPRGAAEASLQRWRRMLKLLEAPLLGYVFVRTGTEPPKRKRPRRPEAAAAGAAERSSGGQQRVPSFSPVGT
jgi:polysaccharide biosynthesis transport protein